MSDSYFNTRSMHAYDALRCAMHQYASAHVCGACGTCGACQKLCDAGLVGPKRQYLACETPRYVLSTFELFLVLFLLSWLLQLTDLFAFLSSESLAVSCVQHSFRHLTPPNTYIANAQLHCPPSPRDVVPLNSVLHQHFSDTLP